MSGNDYTKSTTRKRAWKMRSKPPELSQLKVQFEDVMEFLKTMRAAKEKTQNAWEEEFVISVQDRFDKYGMDAFCSDSQKQRLERIARR